MPSNLNLDYYYGSEAEQYSFYRIPKTLLTDPRYKSVSIEAKVLYGLLLDRMGLSVKNGWMDSDRRVYIYFTQEDAMRMMDCGHNKAVRLFADLEQTGLIERKKQGQGRPTRIYVKNFILPPLPGQAPEPEQPQPPEDGQTSDFGKSALPTGRKGEVLTSEMGKSALPEMGGLDFPKRDANKTENKKTELNDTDPSIFPPAPAPSAAPSAGRPRSRMGMDEMDSYRRLIKENIDYDLLLNEHPHDEETLEGYVELMAEVCCSRRDFIRIAGDEVAAGVVKSRFLKLNHEHIAYVLESLNQNTTLIKNIKAYTLAALYNAPVTISQYYASLVSHDLAQDAAGI
ncbi:MAG: replication initiator protein A [Oscillibacter sp.]|nr:replication initiator protein A [Oscillibacter sp.]